ncbi:MAG: tetratricopeptide repeat protein [Pseudomonadota bacterium]
MIKTISISAVLGLSWQLAARGSRGGQVSVITSAILVFSGCADTGWNASGPTPPIVSESLARFEEQLGEDTAQPEVISSAEFLALPSDIREYLDREVLSLRSEEKRYRALRDWALEEFSPDFEYDPSYTASIEDLPASGRINCFSFSNLFVAAARYTDIPAHFQLVDSPPQWNFNDETWVVSQHINVSGLVYRDLTRKEKAALRAQHRSTGTRLNPNPPKRIRRTYVVDLNPEIAVDAYRSRAISDDAALALFHSNRSVEELLAGNAEAAMMHGRAAIAADQRSPTAWNNFGVLLSREGRLADAEQAYRTALALDPDGETGASNLERVYRRIGDVEKADAMAERIYSNRMRNPYYHYAMGERSLADGELADAVDHFEDAVRRKDDERLFYFALAETHMKLGDFRRAARNLESAKEYSTKKDQKRYRTLSIQLARATAE